MKLTATQEFTKQALEKLDLNIDAIVERLQHCGVCDCQFFSKEEVELAFLNWFNHHVQTIEADTQWFIVKDFKHFEKSLDFDRLQESCETEYDPEEIYAEMAASDFNPANNKLSLEV
ncbi:hypothetical protein QUB63_22605 [Microcoleus sp. ARI1-B5]|uniref:hypothetical protein n=1 Tax=unclassified Microcoleus TaxID=2642155 RepID=UPI002FCFA73E